ncbi:MAG: biopolymer transporter ExbD [Pseudomonadota bacterium]
MASVGGSSKDTLTLNLYPMLDIFSILICFLLMSFSSDPVSHDVDAGVELPESSTIVALDEVPTIVVTKTEIRVNDKKVADIQAGDVPEKERTQGAIYPVFDELKKLADATKRLSKNIRTDDPNAKGSTGALTMEMDKGHRFKLMKRIMLSAQQAEFVQFKLMVQKELH